MAMVKSATLTITETEVKALIELRDEFIAATNRMKANRADRASLDACFELSARMMKAALELVYRASGEMDQADDGERPAYLN